jgi:hypothetical protein
MLVTDLRRALNAEFCKLKHRPILVTVIVLPLLVIAMPMGARHVCLVRILAATVVNLA